MGRRFLKRKPLTDARRDLAAKYTPLAFKLAIRAHNRWPSLDIDDLVSEAMLAVCHAASNFKPRRASFITYAWIAIARRLGSFVARELKRTACEPLYDIDPEDPHQRDPALSAEQREIHEVMAVVMDPRELECFRRVHAKGQTLRHVGHIEGCTSERVRQLNLRAARKVRAVY